MSLKAASSVQDTAAELQSTGLQSAAEAANGVVQEGTEGLAGATPDVSDKVTEVASSAKAAADDASSSLQDTADSSPEVTEVASSAQTAAGDVSSSLQDAADTSRDAAGPESGVLSVVDSLKEKLQPSEVQSTGLESAAGTAQETLATPVESISGRLVGSWHPTLPCEK